MRNPFNPLAVVIALACALAAPYAGYAAPPPPPPDDTNPDGSIKTMGFILQPNGDFSRFTVLTSGALNDNNNNVSGTSSIFGNVGVGNHGNFTMSGGTLNGDLYMNDFGTVSLSGSAKITGRRHGIHETGPGDDPTDQTTVLNNALNGAQYLSGQAAMEMSTSNYTVNGNPPPPGGLTTVNTGQSITIVGSGKVVLNLQDFVMTGGTFTLEGTSTTTYIINVSRNFSLNNAKIVLADLMGDPNGTTRVRTTNVLFNIKGTGNQVTLNQGTSMQGILLAYQRKVNVSGGKVFGRVIAEQLALSGGGQIISQ